MSRLTSKQALFVREYLTDCNAAAAARRAGYSPRTADQSGKENLARPAVAAAIREAMRQRETETEITAARVLTELWRVASSDIRNVARWDGQAVTLIPSGDLSDDAAASIQSIKSETTTTTKDDETTTRTRVEVRLWPKVAALAEIGKHLGIGSQLDVFVHDRLSEMSDSELLAEVKRLAHEVGNGTG